jgi:hypothetical protein
MNSKSLKTIVSFTNPQLVGKCRKNYNPLLAKVGKHREATEP